MKRNLFRRIAALALTLALCAGGASATIADFAIEQPTVYATKHGTYYHYDPVCSGMKNAQAATAGDALAEGKTPCPVCIPAAEQPTVYATKHGTYYHYDPVCSGMKNVSRLPPPVTRSPRARLPVPSAFRRRSSLPSMPRSTEPTTTATPSAPA